VAANEHDPFSAVVGVVCDEAATVRVEAGEGGAYDNVTPPVDVGGGQVEEVLLLGLRAERTFQVRVVSDARGATSPPQPYATGPLPSGFPEVQIRSADPDLDGPLGPEIVCTDGRRGEPGRAEGIGVYFCVDREGVPVWSLEHPQGDTMPMLGGLEVRPLVGGGYASVGSAGLVLFDRRGALTAEYEAPWFDERGRFRHLWVDPHEILQLREGPWAGALALITGVGDTVGDGTFLLGNGVVVFDPASGEVLWDWTSHGDLGDGVPIDPDLPYGRGSPIEDPTDWQHANALVHGLDPDGGQFFWMSLRHQDWIVKIDVETDEIVWRLGHQGDFALVDDLDAAAPALRSPEGWMFHQHAPEVTSRGPGDRIGLVVFDNGNLRPDAAGAWDWDAEPYSRVAGFELDERTLRAAPMFSLGGSDPAAEGGFFSDIRGDADLAPSGDRLLYVVSRTDPPAIVEVTYPAGEEVWRAELPSGSAPYRARRFASLYEMASPTGDP
jgi:hypothetical protein